MFGLIKACGGGLAGCDIESRRLHYCGTCKSMGRMFGQKSRTLLNHDAVFLGELLTALQPREASFSPALVSHRCTAIPSESDIPWALRYAAATNLMLVYFKLADQIADSGSRLARVANRAFASEFLEARRLLAAWDFPLDEVATCLGGQLARESETQPCLERLSEPTATATRRVFEFGAARAGASPCAIETMARVGDAFGQVAYLVDAIKDQERDAKSGGFNALAATGLRRVEAIEILRGKGQEMRSASGLANFGVKEGAIYRPVAGEFGAIYCRPESSHARVGPHQCGSGAEGRIPKAEEALLRRSAFRLFGRSRLHVCRLLLPDDLHGWLFRVLGFWTID